MYVYVNVCVWWEGGKVEEVTLFLIQSGGFRSAPKSPSFRLEVERGSDLRLPLFFLFFSNFIQWKYWGQKFENERLVWERALGTPDCF